MLRENAFSNAGSHVRSHDEEGPSALSQHMKPKDINLPTEDSQPVRKGGFESKAASTRLKKEKVPSQKAATPAETHSMPPSKRGSATNVGISKGDDYTETTVKQ